MKRFSFIVLFIASSLCAVESQFSTHFQRRFGPNSVIYNEPLYFSSQRLGTKKRPPKTRNYRDKIKKNIKKVSVKKKITPKKSLIKHDFQPQSQR